MYIDPDIITENQESYGPKTPLQWAEQALLQANSKPTMTIAQMELLRGVELRWGRDQINLFPPQNCEAALAYSRGQVRNGVLACLDCKRGRGPFAKCVTLKGYLKGSCSNCHYSAEGARCSLRTSEQEQTAKSKTDTKNPSGSLTSIRQSKTLAKRSGRTKCSALLELSDDSASESNTNERIHPRTCPTVLELEWKVRKRQRKAMRMKKLAILHKRIGDLLEEEVDELNEYNDS
ncbi:hypothetical protein BU23DRAFT_630633 [Bimuria novae-zelandiae CBS 107.79]|uniref:Cytochrome c domain-containing protein n=1 Tax=Bimuria novae-zelandiae CBS 107.79 TaxID=1447943 RepID=A0A6A5UP92_9PLEO|nr:hypothetical protein BU23DRAFT_630633 [Bimuria novae-zelandiae CBS 107.79]